MEYLSSASEWLQRHVVHLLLRHGLSHIFANQVDLNQFQVQLRRHALRKCMTWHGQLVDIEISQDFLNQQAIPLGLEIERAVVGSLEVAISFAGPSLTVRLSDLHIHVKPHTPVTTLDDAEPQSPSGCADDQSQSGTPPATASSTLLDRLKPMASAVERMLNTVSCCIERLHIHVHLPGPEHSSESPSRTPSPSTRPAQHPPAAAEQPGNSSRDSGQRRWRAVLTVGSLKLVDTSDCFMAPLGVMGDLCASTLDPDRAVEISKSLFWDDLSIRIVPDDVPAAQHSSASSTSGEVGVAQADVFAAPGRPARAAAQHAERATVGSLDPELANDPAMLGTDTCCLLDRVSRDSGPSHCSDTAAGCQREGGCEQMAASSSEACSQGDDAVPAGPLGPEGDSGCSGVATGVNESDGEEFRDAEEGSDEEGGKGGKPDAGVLLLTGAGGSGWRGKATLQLGWAPAKEGGALRNMRAEVTSCEGAVVAVAVEQLAAVAEAAAAVAAVVERRAAARAGADTGPPVALADLTASMLVALRPGQGMQDVLAVAAQDMGGGEVDGVYGGASCTTEMYDARSLLAGSMMVKGAGETAVRPEGEAEAPFSWQLRVELQGLVAESDAAVEVPALSVSVWDTAAAVGEAHGLLFGLGLQVGSVTGRADRGAGVPMKVSSRLQGLQLLECLSKDLHAQNGADVERQVAARIPALLHVAPPAPAATACATMGTSFTPPPLPQQLPMPEHLHSVLPGAAEATHAWPLVTPALPAHRTCRCAMTTDKAHADVLTVRLPPYAVTLPTASLPLLVRLSVQLGAAADVLMECRGRGSSGGSGSQSDAGLDAWGSMIPGASVPSAQRQRPVELLVTLPRLFCALLAEPTPPKPLSLWSCSSTPRSVPAVPQAHLVLDLRCTAPPGCPANEPPPLLKVMHDPHRSRPLHADASASSISLLLVSSRAGGEMTAHCIAALVPPSRAGGDTAPPDASRLHGPSTAPAALRLSVSLQASAHARCGVIGDPVSRAWLQANAHCRRDWQLGTCPTLQPAASLASTYAPPTAGVLFPVAFSAEEVEEAAHAGSSAVVSIRAPQVSAFVSDDQMASLMLLLGNAIARARVPTAEDAPPVATATHVAVNVAAAARVSIQRADGRMDVDVGRLACVLGQGIGGVAGAAVVHLTATGVRIVQRSTNEESPATLLFHIPAPSPGQGAMPLLEMVSASQPLERQPVAGALRMRTLTSHHMRRPTFGTLEGDLSLSWLNRLSALFQLPAPSLPAPVAVSESSIHLSLEDCALGYMPPWAPAAAAQSLHAAAFVVFARGLHTYTVGSARHVDITSAHVAVGRVRSGGLAPWACAPPPSGWSVQSCAALGLDLIAREDAASVVLDPSAPVDSDAGDAQPPGEVAATAAVPPPAQLAGMHLAAADHRVIGSTGEAGWGTGAADPLLAHVWQRRAADERGPAAAAAAASSGPRRAPAQSPPAVGSRHRAMGRGQPAAVPSGPVQIVEDAQPAGGVTARAAAAEPPASASSEGALVFGGSHGDSDMEVLSGRDACMMAVTKLQLQRLSIMLTPDSCALVHSLAEQLAASFAAQADGDAGHGGGACTAANTTYDGASHAMGDLGSLGDSHASVGTDALGARGVAVPAEAEDDSAAADGMGSSAAGRGAACSDSELPSCGAPAWPEDRSELRFDDGGSGFHASGHLTHDVHLRSSAQHPPAEARAGSAGSGGNLHGGMWGAVSGQGSEGSEPVVQDMAMSNMFDDASCSGQSISESRSIGQASAQDGSGSSFGSPAPSPALDQTLFVDASSTLIASAMLGRSEAGIPATPRSDSGGGMPPPDMALLPASAPSQDIMHDMMLAGASVIAVGTRGARSPGQGLSSAGIPTEQEADGVVLPELQGMVEGLLSVVVEGYVDAEASQPPPRLQEPVTGRLGGQYPDSCQRVSVAAQSVTVLLRPDGVSAADLPAAVRVQGGGLVRLQVSAVRMQHDVFPDSVSSHMRVAAAARVVVAQQAGFGARGAALLRKDGSVAWRPLATQLAHGPSDPRRDVLRLLLRTVDTVQGTREASAWLRLPSLRLHLEQPCLLFLRDFGSGIKRQQEQANAAAHAASASAPVSPHSLSSGSALLAPADPAGEGPMQGLEALAASTDSCTLLVSFGEVPAAAATMHNVLFRTVEIASFALAVDYIPTTTDYAALREGSLFELVNLVNWNNVRVEFKAASLQRVHGAEALLRLLAARWLSDIRSNQAARVLEGATPVASFVRLGAAVHRLAAHAATMPISTQRQSRPEREETVVARRQLHRNARYLLHTLTLEALGLGAWVAGGTAGLLGVEVLSTAATGEVAEQGNVFLESADLIRKEVGAALFALLSRPAAAMQQGQGLHGAAWAAATAVPQAIRRPLGATAAAMQRTCIGMQHAVEYTLPPSS
eukprot:jgi/Ulvmu1/4500/UM002_0226.1